MGKSNRLRFSCGLDRKPELTGAGLRRFYCNNVDLVNDNVYTKFGLNRSIRFQDIELNLILTSIKGHNSVANLPKFELIQAFMHVLVTCKNEEDPI